MLATEELIIKQLKDGNEKAYKYLYDHHYVVLCHIANQYINDHFLSESIVSDVIFHLWEVRESLDISISIRSYLIRSVRNRCLNYLNTKSERQEIPFSCLSSDKNFDLNYFFSEEHPLGSLLERELENKIQDAIQNLPDDCKRVFMKSRFEGKKYEEIAKELDFSVNTVKYHMKKALSILHKNLSDYFFIFLFLLIIK
jgi:RNA polymerase sigma-70 factor, ECF subfamily